MLSLREIGRLVTIQRILIRHGLDEIIFSTPFLSSLSFLLRVLPWNWRKKDYKPRAERIREVLEDLGPLFVKLGQILSTRRDVLSEEIADELAKLQDHVPPFSGNTAKKIIEKAFGKKLSEIFPEFNEEPIASASIAQVHLAELDDGREVIVKVVRPDLKKTISQDIGLMYFLADFAERYLAVGKLMKPSAIVAEFEKTILDELDMLREAANASPLKRNLDSSDLVHIPEVFWEFVRPNVLVMEKVSGLNIGDLDSLRQQQIDLKQLAEDGISLFFTQDFRDHYFHADLHPGNLFVITGESGERAKYAVVDFGIMGGLTPDDQRYLAENFLAFFNRDYYRVAELHVQSEWVPSDTRVDEFESAIRSVCEPIFERPLKDISFANLLIRLFQTARRFNMEVQPQLVLLQKTLLNIEGLGRQLYPERDLWQTAKPFLEQWVRERGGVQAAMRELRKQAPRWGEIAPALPNLAYDVIRQARDGQLKLQLSAEELTEIKQTLRRSNQRLGFTVLGAALLMSAFVLLGLADSSTRLLAGVPLMTWWLAGVGGVLVAAGWTTDRD